MNDNPFVTVLSIAQPYFGVLYLVCNNGGFCFIRGSNYILYPFPQGGERVLKQNGKAPKRGFNLAGS